MPVNTSAYRIKSIIKMDNPKVKLFRIEPTDLSITLREIFNSLSDLCWISNLPNVSRVFKMSMQHRADQTLEKIKSELELTPDSKVSSSAGEYLVSELARSTCINDLHYLDIPLAELIKEKVSGNPGYDFYTINNNTYVLLFGEAKYESRKNAYPSAFEQLDRFVKDGKDINDMATLERFCPEESQEQMANGIKGYIAAFSATSISDKVLKNHIEKDEHYKKLLIYDEIVCVAVNLSKDE